MKVRAILWTVTMAYSGFLLTGQGLRTFNKLSITEAALGALTGALLAIMFTLRESGDRGPALLRMTLDNSCSTGPPSRNAAAHTRSWEVNPSLWDHADLRLFRTGRDACSENCREYLLGWAYKQVSFQVSVSVNTRRILYAQRAVRTGQVIEYV
jgi:hypothetical protein